MELLDAELKHRLNAAVTGAGHSLLSPAVGEVLLFTIYRLWSAVIDDNFNKRSSIN